MFFRRGAEWWNVDGKEGGWEFGCLRGIGCDEAMCMCMYDMVLWYRDDFCALNITSYI